METKISETVKNRLNILLKLIKEKNAEALLLIFGIISFNFSL